MTRSIVEEIGAGRILADLLRERGRVLKNGVCRCLNPTHEDIHPSMSVDLEKGVFCCHSAKCGVKGGALAAAILCSLGRDESEAATTLSEKYGTNGHANGNGHAEPVKPLGADDWPWFPMKAKELGWELVDGGAGKPGLRVPTWLPDGKQGRTKIRWKKGDWDTAAFENDGDEIGMIGLDRFLDHSAGVESPSCALVCGETDFLAWTWATAVAGIDIPAVSAAQGETKGLSWFAPCFKGVKVYFFPDNDEAGRKEAPKRAAELRKEGATVIVCHPPDPHKDVCDWVRAHASARDILAFADKQIEAPFTPIGALDLIHKQLPPIEELVSPRVIYRGGVTVLVAAYKRGKSLAALGLCVDLVEAIIKPEGTPDDQCPLWLGQKVVGQGPCLIYSAEGGERMVQERLRKIIPAPNDHHNELYIYAQSPPPQLDNPQHLDAVFSHAERLGCVCVVFDPLGRFWKMEEEADAAEARNLMFAIQTRAERAYNGRGLAVLCVHHDNKTTGTDENSPVTGGRGSGKFADDADALVNLKIVSSGEAGESTAKFLLRHAESPAPVPVKIDSKTLRLIPRDPNAPSSTTTKRTRGGGGKSGRPAVLTVELLENLVRGKGRVEGMRVPGELGISDSTWKKNRKSMVTDLLDAGLIKIDNIPGATPNSTREVFVWIGPQGVQSSESAAWEPRQARKA